MLKRKTLAVATAALLGSAMAIQPTLAQYGSYGGYPTYPDEYQQSQSQYDRDRDYYERQRDQYDRDRNAYDYNYRGYYNNYRVQDDARYDDCAQQRAGNQAGGLIVGAIAGGLLGSTIAHGPARGSGTAIGAILGGALGASIGGRLNCDDRNYVYRTYYSGFERGVTHVPYRWRNPRSGNYGVFVVNDYYRGPSGYRCARYEQTIYVRGRAVPATGHACRQADGHWVVID